jgi:tripartite-type tricarboxylate transporter receptor subunit TctC
MRAWLLLAVLWVGPFQAPAQAQQWPSRPLRVLVPSAAGGAGDIVARAVGQKLTEAWGQ